MSRSVVFFLALAVALLCLFVPRAASVNIGALSTKLENQGRQALNAKDEEEVTVSCTTFGTAGSPWERCYDCVTHRGSGRIRSNYACIWNPANSDCHSTKGGRAAWLRTEEACATQYSNVNTAHPATGYEYESGFPLVQKPTIGSFLQAAPGKVAAVSAAQNLGPNQNLHAFQTTVDLGATQEYISGPILNTANDQGDFQRVVREWHNALVAHTANGNCKPNAKTALYNNNNQQGVRLSDIVPTYNGALPGPLQAAYTFNVQEPSAFANWYVLCQGGLPAAPSFQVNYGLKLSAIGATDNRFINLFAPYQAHWQYNGVKLFTNIRNRVNTFFTGEAQLSALAASPKLRGFFTYYFWLTAIKAYRSTYQNDLNNQGNGWPIKNVMGQMIKVSAQDALRLLDADEKNAVATWVGAVQGGGYATVIGRIVNVFCSNVGCNGAHGFMNGVATALNANGGATMRNSFQTELTTTLTGAANPFDADPVRYPLETAAPLKYGIPEVVNKPPLTHYGIILEKSYPPFLINGEWAIVVESRVPCPFNNNLLQNFGTPFNWGTLQTQMNPSFALLNTANA